MDSEHIWSGNWPSIWSTTAQQTWQLVRLPPFGRPAVFRLTWFGCSQITCQEIFLIPISSVTKVDQAVLFKTQIVGCAAIQLQMFIGEMEHWNAILTCHCWGYYASAGLLICQKYPRSHFWSQKDKSYSSYLPFNLYPAILSCTMLHHLKSRLNLSDVSLHLKSLVHCFAPLFHLSLSISRFLSLHAHTWIYII